jgi:DNA-directed RNA polymerase specialized sigma24 family protein
MLQELCKRDKDWRKMAFQICKDKYKSDDLVQEMYLKFANYSKPLNDYYIFFAIRSIFLDEIKKSKLQLSDIELENISLTDETYCFDKDYFETSILLEVETLPYFERETLKVTQTISQRELSRQTEIPLITIKKTIKKTKESLKIWVTENQNQS